MYEAADDSDIEVTTALNHTNLNTESGGSAVNSYLDWTIVPSIQLKLQW